MENKNKEQIIMRKYIENYIIFYLENDDEFTEKNKEKFTKILQNNEIMEELAQKLGAMKLEDMQDINYEISKLLEGVQFNA